MSLLDVFDLPQLYTKPSAEALLDTLALLASTPPSWDCNDNIEQSYTPREPVSRLNTRAGTVHVNLEGATRYLTSIVSSSLQWIQNEEAKEQIWSQASLRLSERSGRAAMSAMSRRFRIPAANDSFELSIHEPALTGDDLGLKTWAASYLLAKRLHTFGFLKSLFLQGARVLELGSGTGLVGLAMAGLGADVVLTDLPSIYPNLTHNAQSNSTVIEQRQGSTRTGILDWNHPISCVLKDAAYPDDYAELIDTTFRYILAADSLYSPEHPRILVNTIDAWLSKEMEARVIVEFPYRDAYLPEISDFRERMASIGLRILTEGEEKGFDDWGWSGADEERGNNAMVTCWWSCWGRNAQMAE